MSCKLNFWRVNFKNFDMTENHRLSDEDFTEECNIGSGSFSTVVKAVDKQNRVFALKKLFWNNAPDRIVKEMTWLAKLDHPNIVKLYGAYRNQDQATLVMGYVPHIPFRSLIPELNGNIIKQYMRGLLEALKYLHQRKVIHRDVKPTNFLFDPATGHGCLIDFGLCEEDIHIDIPPPPPQTLNLDNDNELNYPDKYQNRRKMVASREGTRGFRAPEVLFSYPNQSCLIDIWSAGVILLSLLTRRYPFFKSPDDLTSICEIAMIVGTKRLHEAAHECGRKLRFPAEHEAAPLPELIQSLNNYFEEMNCDECVFDLLAKMLEPCPSKRISAADALEHEFFKI